MSQAHDLKTHPPFWARVAAREKPFEVRRDDRDFQVGDRLILREWAPNPSFPNIGKYTGSEAGATISYIYRGPGVADGYCVLGLEDITVTAWPLEAL